MVAPDLMVERSQIEAYTALIRELGDRDFVTHNILIGILQQTEQHASELADYIKRTAETQK
jgi:bacterioferritin (cytochrome b1)